MEPGYQNWLISKQTEKTRTPETTTIQIPPGLQLSTRRGPEVELYDVTGVHLLNAGISCNPGRSNKNFRRSRQQWRSGMCWKRFTQSQHAIQSRSTSVILTNNKASDIKSANSSDYTLGRLPVKSSQRNSLDPARQASSNLVTKATFNSQRTCQVTSNGNWTVTGPNCAPCVSCDQSHSSCFHHLMCSNQTDVDGLPSEHRNYYSHCFALLHHRIETSILLTLILFMSLAQTLFILIQANWGFGSLSPSSLSTKPSFTAVEIGRLTLFSASVTFALLGLVCVNWQQCSSCASQKMNNDRAQLNGKSTAKEEEESNSSREQIAYHLAHLLAAQRFDKRLRVTYVMVYLCCLCLAAGMLPWFYLFEYAVSPIWSRYNCSRGDIAFSNVSDMVTVTYPVLRLTTWPTQSANMMAPVDCIWVIMWIIVAVHGLLDVDRLWSTRGSFAFTITLSLAHLILTNVLETLTQPNRSTSANRPGAQNIISLPNSVVDLCSAKGLHSAVLVYRPSWWDNPASLMGRQNVASMLALAAAHLIGQLIARWTARHRYRLFVFASHTQAKLDRLTATEDKLVQLANSLVPTPLAKDLGKDFVAGYLAWSSPLVIYLRNVSFISVELVGLSTVASVVANAPNSSGAAACQQLVAFLNDLFGCFDRLARSEGCYRVRLNAAEYLCIAGYPETRVDHARSCVAFGLAMLKTVNELSQMTNVQLELHVAVHTGTAYAAVLGRSRLGFELTGDDVDFASRLRQMAVRPGRVLASRTTFSQLPEGFCGEAGPSVAFRSPEITAKQTVESGPEHTMDTFFIQPRGDGNNVMQDHSSTWIADCSDPMHSNSLGIGFKGPSNDWPKLSDFSLERVTLLNRLSSSASVICRRPVQDQDMSHPTAVEQPLDFLFRNAEASEASKEVRYALLQTLSGDSAGPGQVDVTEPTDKVLNGALERSTHSGPDSASTQRDPSTTELLAMAAVTLANSFEHQDGLDRVCPDKIVPCQRRAGRLRGKCPTELADSTDAGSGLGADNSMGTSLATMTTTAMNPSLPSHEQAPLSTVIMPIEARQCPSRFLLSTRISWLGAAPPGEALPHWLTLRTTRFTKRCPQMICTACPSSKSYSSLTSTTDGGLDESENRKPRPVKFCPCASVATDAEEKGQHVTVDAHFDRRGLDGTKHQILPIQLLSFTLNVLIPLLAVLGLIHLLVVSRSFLYLAAYLVALAYLGLQLLLCVLLKRFSGSSGQPMRIVSSRLFLISSTLVITAACAVNWIVCLPGFPVGLVSAERVVEENASSHRHHPFTPVFLVPDLYSTSPGLTATTAASITSVSGQYMMLGCIGVMLVAVAGASTLYLTPIVTSTDALRIGEPDEVGGGESEVAAHMQLGALTFSQPVRIVLGLIVLAVYVACLFWAALSNGALHYPFMQIDSDANPVEPVTFQLARVAFAQHLLAFGAFALLAFFLPRGLEFQCVLFQQWLSKNRSVTQSLINTRLALARLLLSVIPRYVVAALCNRLPGKSTTAELYGQHYPSVGLAVIQLSVVTPPPVARERKASMEQSTPATKKSTLDEPAQIADRLRLMNHVINLIDALVDDEVLNATTNMESSKHEATESLSQTSRDPRLVKVFVGGTVLGYAVGLLPSKTIRDQSSRSEQMTNLLSFTERVLQACEETNSKTRMASGLVHARIALHTSPALVGLIGKQRPTFGLWGEAVNVCLRLLHESHVPALNCQHLLLATDEVINAVPTSRLSSTGATVAGRPLIWRCVDSSTGQIVPSTQARSLASYATAPGGPAAPRPSCLPLHFCSLQVAMAPVDGDVATGDSTARAVLTLAQRTSGRTTSESYAAMHRSAATPPVSNRSKNSANAQTSRQSARMSHVAISSSSVDVIQTTASWGLHASQSDVPLFSWAPQFSGPSALDHQSGSTAAVLRSPLTFPAVPPLPPHQRAYPSAGPLVPVKLNARSTAQDVNHLLLGANRLDAQPTTSVAFAQLRATPDRKGGDSNAIVNRRRGVVSQFTAGTHDYSIVNTEPPTIGRGPNQGRVTSQLIDRRQTQPAPYLFREEPGHPSDTSDPWNGRGRQGDYWPDQPTREKISAPVMNGQPSQSSKPVTNSTASDAAPLHRLMFSVLNQPTKPGDLRPISLSSTDSFLAAERACALSDFGDVGPVSPSTGPAQQKCDSLTNGFNPEVEKMKNDNRMLKGSGEVDDQLISHHNPLYTDNEYESMTESQGNLVDACVNIPYDRAARSRSINSNRATSGHSDLQSHDGDDGVKLLGSSCNSAERQLPTGAAHSSAANGNGYVNKLTAHEAKINGNTVGTCAFRVGQLDFPDIQRPSSPCGGVLKLRDRRNHVLGTEPLNDARQRPPAYVAMTAEQNSLNNNNNTKSTGLQQSSSASASGSSSVVRSAGTGCADLNQPNRRKRSGVVEGAPSLENGITGFGQHSVPAQSSNNGVLTSSHCSDSILLDQSRVGTNGFNGSIGMHEKQCYPTPPAFHVSSVKSISPNEQDGTDVDYMGTYSLGPVSLAVIPSIADDGLTSCDGEELGRDDDEDPYADEDEDDDYAGDDDYDASAVPESITSSFHRADVRPFIGASNFSGWSPNHLFPPSSSGMFGGGMTDSLLANPDLDAPESELGDEFDLNGDTAPAGSPLPPHGFHAPRISQLTGRIEPSQAPEFLEAALLPPPPGATTYTGSNSTKDLYSMPSTEDGPQSDTDDLFAYHTRPGMDPRPNTTAPPPLAMFAFHQRTQPGFTIAHTVSSPSSATGPAGRQFISSHAMLHLQQQQQPTRPALPDVAPVGMPDFARLPDQSAPAVPHHFARLLNPPEVNSQSDYDNVCTTMGQGSTKPVPATSTHGCASARKLSAARRRINRWQSITPGDESDAMSGYIGDAASSVYDTGDDEDEEDDDNDDLEDANRFNVTQLYIPHPPRELTDVDTSCPNNPETKPGPTDSLVDSGDQHSPRVNGRSSGAVSNKSAIPIARDARSILTNLPRSTAVTARSKAIEVHRTPSSAGSQTSGPEMRSEYDNVDTNDDANETVLKDSREGVDAPARSSTRIPSRRRCHVTHRAGSFNVKRSEITQRLFDAQIAAEARRISRQFRAMGWLPASAVTYSPVEQRSPTEVDEAFGLHTAGSNQPVLPSKPVMGLARPNLFLLPTDSPLSSPCSRQASVHGRLPLHGGAQSAIRDGGGSMQDSETMTTVTSQFDDEDDENRFSALLGLDVQRLGGVANGLVVGLDGKQAGLCPNDFHAPWDTDYFAEENPTAAQQQLGCLLIRPRSLSATCLNSSATAEAYRDSFLRSSSSADLTSEEEEEPVVNKQADSLRTEQPRPSYEPDKKILSMAPSVRQRGRQIHLSSSAFAQRATCRTNDPLSDMANASKRSAVSPGLSRLQRRAARVRSVIPPELLPYILPTCMSSSSRSSSIVSSTVGQSGIIFLSLSRRQRSRRYNRMKCARKSEHRAHNGVDDDDDDDADLRLSASRRHWTSDPELSLGCR